MQFMQNYCQTWQSFPSPLFSSWLYLGVEVVKFVFFTHWPNRITIKILENLKKVWELRCLSKKKIVIHLKETAERLWQGGWKKNVMSDIVYHG